jgi:acetolactate synthase-1/2/3 large subunit
MAGAVLQQPAVAVELNCFPDPEKLAGAYGFKGRTVESRASAAPRSKKPCASPVRILLNVRVTPFENVYPMVPAGGAINEMVLGPPQPVEAYKCCN